MIVIMRALIIFLLATGLSSFAAAETKPKEKTAAVTKDSGEGLLNKLLAPGPLMEGHHDLEHADCLTCHELRKGVPDSKCLDCHKEIRALVEKKRSYHGLTKKTCIQCHSDHKGRDYDSTEIDEDKFDHKQTGFVLEGEHKELDCDDCHVEKRSKAKKATRPDDVRYLGLKTTCVSCHEEDDVHYFKGDWAKKDCDACHGGQTWKKDIKFDHKKDAKYQLEGKHAKTECAKCHVPTVRGEPGPSKYKWDDLTTNKCRACHDDHHKTNLSEKYSGGDCTKCHSQKTWKIDHFDHDITKYPLKGKHAKINCVDCHKQTPAIAKKGLKDFKWTGLKSDCLSCHKDYHQFANRRSEKLGSLDNCLNCHNEVKWKDIRKFEHNKHTRFEIGGKHKPLKCEKCHISDKLVPRKRLYQWSDLATKTCEVCHKNPHLKNTSKAFTTKKCSECHTDESWTEVKKKGGVGFNHDKDTRFELTGKHKEITCKKCHLINKKQYFKFNYPEKNFCDSCHRNVHTKQFTRKFSDKACSDCHSAKNFTERLEFDHDTTNFKIDGKHDELKCEKCHTPTRDLWSRKPLRYRSKFLFAEGDKKYCVSCHENEHTRQFHKGFYDQACDACHTTKDFIKRREFDHNDTAYKLLGKHMDLKCSKCHIETREFFKTKPPHVKSKYLFPEMYTRDCAACHKDPHKGTFGNKCSDCHTERDWKKTQDFHKGFTLSGVHYTLECQECHTNGRRLTGMNENCVACHQKDDIHNGTLPNCGECHRQQFWENTEFKHAMSLFPLRGIHRTLDCYSCHNTGIYKGLSNRCTNCHQSDAQAVVSPPHNVVGIANFDCYCCHNQFSFLPAASNTCQ